MPTENHWFAEDRPADPAHRWLFSRLDAVRDEPAGAEAVGDGLAGAGTVREGLAAAGAARDAPAPPRGAA
ncbi:hypothetical protein [Streptomyces adustus]